MPNAQHDEWSPADHPYAIAVSEAQWWRSAVGLAAARLGDPIDPRASPMSSHQIDARNLVFALAQLLNAEQLEQVALSELDVVPSIGRSLARARTEFLDALQGIREVRNALTHFDEWARGSGLGEQKRAVDAGESPRDAARRFWGFGYDRASQSVLHGPYRIEVKVAIRAATDLSQAIYEAARQVDLHSNRDDAIGDATGH